MKPSDDRIVFSTNQFRTYGATDTVRVGWEKTRGCPRLYRARYVDRDVPEAPRDPALGYGSVIHEVLARMESEARGPEDVLSEVWDTELPAEMFEEALRDLDRYLETGGPMTLHATLDNEIDMEALLYEDPEYGPVYFRGIIDWIGVDSSSDRILHVTDFKTSRMPVSANALQGDIQLKGYAWLVRENHQRWMRNKPLIVSHLDLIKFRDVEVRYSDHELDEWHAWAVAAARTILRDEAGEPRLNPGCSRCPIRSSCSLIQSLPDEGIGAPGDSIEDRWAWRNKADAAIKALGAQIVAIDDHLEDLTRQHGSLTFADQEWHVEQRTAHRVDVNGLWDRIGERALEVLTVSRTALERWRRRNLPEESFDDLYDVIVTGEKIKKGNRS